MTGNHVCVQVNRRHIFCFVTLCLVASQLFGCGRGKNYSQTTADDTVASLGQMLKDGNVQQIPSLIYAEDPHVKTLLDKLGPMFEQLQSLSATAKEKYPTEFAALVEKAKQMGTEKAGEIGRANGQEGWDDRVKAMLANPFGTLDAQMSRLSTVDIDDDTCALMVDGQPAFGIGVLLRKDAKNGKWYFQLPTSLPGLRERMPQTDAEWKIVGSMLDSITNGINWAQKAINNKEGGSLQDVWSQVMMNVGPNIAVQGAIYRKAVEIHDKHVRDAKANAQKTTMSEPGH